MTKSLQASTEPSAAQAVRTRVERGGERLWRLSDFGDLPFPAVAQALSRMHRAGALDRLSKGTYYRPRTTTFGRSLPSPAALQTLATRSSPLFPAGVAAAGLLGFTTQTAARSELATSAQSVPRKLVGEGTIVHTRRPQAWSALSSEEAALLDFLRTGGTTSELSAEQTAARTIELLSHADRYARLFDVSSTEPPRVRALLGALGEKVGASPSMLRDLRSSLNPLSRYDFGILTCLPNATRWQAKKRSRS
jgi:hypothetical protein